MVRAKLFNESGLTGVELANMVERPYQTLMRELNPHDARAKLSIEEFAKIIKATGRYDILKDFAEYSGCSVEIVKAG
jgi:hypothetical protein